MLTQLLRAQWSRLPLPRQPKWMLLLLWQG